MGFLRRFWIFCFASIFIAASPGSNLYSKPSQSNRYVQTYSDFILLVESHIARVILLGLELRAAFPDHFSLLDPDILAEALSHHDEAKLETSRAFKRNHSYPRAMDPMSAILFERYGTDLRNVGRVEQMAFRHLIRLLNGMDQRVMRSFYDQQGWLRSDGSLGPRAQAVSLIERIADLVDRGMSPVSREEFNKTMTPASEFLESEEGREMAAYLESHYWEITGGNHPLETPPSERAKPLGRGYRGRIKSGVCADGLRRTSTQWRSWVVAGQH